MSQSPYPNLIRHFHAPLAARLLILVACLGCAMSGRALDLRNAVIVSAPDATPRQKQAVKMLVEEAEKRTEDAAGVEPADATLAEDFVPIDIAGLELRSGGVAAVGAAESGAHAESALREIEAVA